MYQTVWHYITEDCNPNPLLWLRDIFSTSPEVAVDSHLCVLGCVLGSTPGFFHFLQELPQSILRPRLALFRELP